MHTRIVNTHTIALVGICLLFPLTVFAQGQKVGVVGALMNSAEMRSVAGEIRNLVVGADVYVNDTVITGEAGKVQLIFLDRSSLTVNAASEVTIDTFIFDPNTSTGDLGLKGAKGAFRFIGGALSKENPVTIKTPVSTIGIRGGIADTHISPNGATDAIFVYGKEMTMQNANGQVVRLTEFGKGLTMPTPDAAPVPLPPEVVAKRVGTFSQAAPNAPNNSSMTNNKSNVDEGNSASPATSDTKGSNEDTNNSPADSRETNDSQEMKASAGNGEKENSKDGENTSNTAGDAPGGLNTKESSSDGAEKSEPKQASAATGTKQNKPAPRKVLSVARPLPGSFGNAVNFAANDIGNLGNNIADGANQIRVNNGSVNSFNDNSSAFSPTHKGKFVRSDGTFLREGSAEFAEENGRLKGKFTQQSPDTGAVLQANFPQPTSEGYFGIGGGNQSVLVDGAVFNGKGYTAKNRSMYYYFLQEASGSREISAIVGTEIQNSDWNTAATVTKNKAFSEGTNGITFYDFLPGMGGTQNGNDLGQLRYNIANSNLVLPQNQAPDPGNAGLIVDWNHMQFLTAFINWEDTGAFNSPRTDMIVSLGNINTSGNDSFLQGNLIELGSAGAGQFNPFDLEIGTGTLNNTNQLYGQGADREIDGFVISGQADVGAERLLQGAVRADATAEQRNAVKDKTTETLRGFTAGYVVENSRGAGGGTPTAQKYWNTAPNGVIINKDKANNSVGGDFAIFKPVGGGGGANSIDAKFGSATSGTHENVFISDELYAAQSGKVVYDAGGSAQTYDGQQASAGAMISGEALSDVDIRCNTCDFVEWGVWAVEVDKGTIGNKRNTDVVALMPYVAGKVTQDLASNVSPQSLGTVNYTGAMYGTTKTISNNALQRHTGSFNAQINLNKRELNNYQAQFAGMNFSIGSTSPASINGNGDATFSNVAVIGQGGDIQGHINGALFGPNAEEIGGNFDVKQISSGTDATGVYIGSR